MLALARSTLAAAHAPPRVHAGAGHGAPRECGVLSRAKLYTHVMQREQAAEEGPAASPPTLAYFRRRQHGAYGAVGVCAGTHRPSDEDGDTNTMQDPNSPITLRTRKFITNRLLHRKQMVLDVIHPQRPNVSRAELQEKLGELYKTPKEQCFVFGMRTHYGGGCSTGFALIYDSPDAVKLECTFRRVRVRTLRKGCANLRTVSCPRSRSPRASSGKSARSTWCLCVSILTLQPCQEGPRHEEEQGRRRQEEVNGHPPSSWISHARAAPVHQPTSSVPCILTLTPIFLVQ